MVEKKGFLIESFSGSMFLKFTNLWFTWIMNWLESVGKISDKLSE